ncbi:MAG: sigma-70 family RNA polymerase sigma factor [Myxococcales bacterium]|nr:sigma-70 family RNA polymerase sigma factor [Myxococcales bacterium]
MNNDDDLELLRQWQSGHTPAGRELVARHYAAVYRFFYGKVDPGFCEDLTQASFEVLCRRRDDFRGGGASFRGFLFGIARMKLIEHVRGKLRAFDPMEHSVVDPATAGSLSSLLADRQHEHLVAQALRELSLDDQVLLELKEYEQLTLRELADLFATTIGSVAGRVTRARERLRLATERLVADPALRAASVHDLESCMRSIGARIAAHLGGKKT